MGGLSLDMMGWAQTEGPWKRAFQYPGEHPLSSAHLSSPPQGQAVVPVVQPLSRA